MVIFHSKLLVYQRLVITSLNLEDKQMWVSIGYPKIDGIQRNIFHGDSQRHWLRQPRPRAVDLTQLAARGGAQTWQTWDVVTSGEDEWIKAVDIGS